MWGKLYGPFFLSFVYVKKKQKFKLASLPSQLELSVNDGSSPASFVFPGGQATHAPETTCSLIPQAQ